MILYKVGRSGDQSFGDGTRNWNGESEVPLHDVMDAPFSIPWMVTSTGVGEPEELWTVMLTTRLVSDEGM